MLTVPACLSVEPEPFLSLPDFGDENDPLLNIDLAENKNLLLESRYDNFSLHRSLLPTGDYDHISHLGGYPVWIQDDATPKCPACGNRASLVVAIGSDDTDLLWGDSGYWYIFACKKTAECRGLEKPLMHSQCY